MGLGCRCRGNKAGVMMLLVVVVEEDDELRLVALMSGTGCLFSFNAFVVLARLAEKEEIMR